MIDFAEVASAFPEDVFLCASQKSYRYHYLGLGVTFHKRLAARNLQQKLQPGRDFSDDEAFALGIWDELDYHQAKDLKHFSTKNSQILAAKMKC